MPPPEAAGGLRLRREGSPPQGLEPIGSSTLTGRLSCCLQSDWVMLDLVMASKSLPVSSFPGAVLFRSVHSLSPCVSDICPCCLPGLVGQGTPANKRTLLTFDCGDRGSRCYFRAEQCHSLILHFDPARALWENELSSKISYSASQPFPCNLSESLANSSWLDFCNKSRQPTVLTVLL
jgi:hypothetical protein